MPSTNHFDAGFGVELECYLPEGVSQQDAAAAVAARLGAPCQVAAYGHTVLPHWKVVTDGSLGDYARGVEFVSPILHGESGLAQVEIVCRAMSDFGCTVSRRCGLHVHVGVANAPLTFFKNLVKLYAVFEPVIDSVMPSSRRASSNAYCRSMSHANPQVVDRATDLGSVIQAATGSNPRQETRFFKLNLNSYHRHRTVEFRQHSATLDPVKARHWTVLCLRMVATAKRDSLPLGSAPSVNQARPGSKTHTVGQMMLRPEGVTGREICLALNWPSVSIPQQARACGLTFTTQRLGREVRYFAVSGQTTAPTVEITLTGFVALIEASEEERQYLQQRATDLAGPVQWAA